MTKLKRKPDNVPLKVPVTERALIQRINRKLADRGTHGEVLKKVRPERGEGISYARLNLGDYYIVDVARNFVVDKDINLAELGRELAVLKPWEKLAGDGE